MASTRHSYTGPGKPPLDEEELPPPDENADLTSPVSMAPPAPPPAPINIPVPPPPPIAPDRSAELADLRSKEDSLRNVSILARTGDKISAALTGRAPDPHAADGIDKIAQTNRSRFDEDGRLAMERLKSQQVYQDADPDSAGNMQYRATIAPILGDKMVSAIGPAFNRLTRTQIEKVIPNLKDRFKQDLSTNQFAAKEHGDALKEAMEGNKFEETKRHNLATEKTANVVANRVSVSDGSSTDSEGVTGRMGIKSVQDLSKFFESVAPTMRDYMRLETLAPGITRNKVPQFLEGDDWERFKATAGAPFGGKRVSDPTVKAINQTVQNISQQIRHDRYGSALTPGEAASWEQVFDTSLKGDWEEQALALNTFRQALGSRIAARVAGAKSTFPDQYRGFMDQFPLAPGLGLFTNDVASDIPKNPGASATPAAAPTQAPAPVERTETKVTLPDGREAVERVVKGIKVRSYDGGATWNRVHAGE